MIQDANPFADTAFSASKLYGIAGQGATYGVAAPIQHMASDDYDIGWRTLLDPHNPIFWFGVVLACTLGAVGVAGSVKLGPAKLTAAVGKS